MVAAVTARQRAAQKRRDLHKQRIDGSPTLLRKIAQAWAWTFSEIKDLAKPRVRRWSEKGQPVEDILADVLDEVTALAERLNEEGARR